jgi:hypothetical protein
MQKEQKLIQEEAQAAVLEAAAAAPAVMAGAHVGHGADGTAAAAAAAAGKERVLEVRHLQCMVLQLPIALSRRRSASLGLATVLCCVL